MKITALRPCDACKGPIAPIFYVVRTSIAMVDQKEIKRTLGLAEYFGGGNAGFALANIMGPDPDVVTVGGDKHPELWSDLFICQECYMKPITLPVIAEHRQCELDANKQQQNDTETQP